MTLFHKVIKMREFDLHIFNRHLAWPAGLPPTSMPGPAIAAAGLPLSSPSRASTGTAGITQK